MQDEVEFYNEKLAEIYDRVHHFKDYDRDVAYLAKCVRQRHPEAATLLDVACGTGNFTGRFAALWRAEGLDLSPAMLKRAQLKFPDTVFHHGNMIDFNLGRSYDIVCCMFRTIAFVQSTENLRRSVLCMARHLNPGGLLCIEPFFTPQNYWIGHVKMNLLDEPDYKIAWMYVSEREDRIGVMKNHYLVGQPSGVEHFEETHKMALFDHSDYEAAFDAAGLDMTYDPAGPNGVGFYIGSLRNNADESQ